MNREGDLQQPKVNQLNDGYLYGHEGDGHLDPNWLETFQQFCSRAFTSSKAKLKWICVIFTVCGYFIYLGFAIHFNYDNAIPLIVWTAIVSAIVIYVFTRDTYGELIYYNVIHPIGKVAGRYWPTLCWLVYPVLAITVVVYVVFIINTYRQLQSLAGMVVFMTIPLMTCKHPRKIKWRPVIWGMGLQFCLGVMVLRTKPGYKAIRFLSAEITKFLMYSLEGAAVAFGNPTFIFHPFFMMVVPLLIYVGAVSAVLYYLGIMQIFVKKMGFLMRITLTTTGIESISLALNVFLSVAETILIVKPYIPKLTTSEFHCLLVGSHTTIAGWAYGLFVMVGVDGQHILTAAVMSAPAAVAISKLNYPETEKSIFQNEDDLEMEALGERNVVEAMGNGAWQAAKTVCNFMVQIIALISIWRFMDATIAWLGSRVGIELSFQIIFSYTFMPLAWLLGIEWHEAEKMGSILGLKLTANEILSFVELGALRRAGEITEKAAALITYAICGFSSMGTLIMFVGVWSTVDSSRVHLVGNLLPRIYMNSNLACFLTASIAGILYDEEVIKGLTTPTEPPLFDLNIFFGLLPNYKYFFSLAGLA